jgi:hypothetical protein
MHRFMPRDRKTKKYRMTALPIGRYPARSTQAAALMHMIQNNLDPVRYALSSCVLDGSYGFAGSLPPPPCIDGRLVASAAAMPPCSVFSPTTTSHGRKKSASAAHSSLSCGLAVGQLF